MREERNTAIFRQGPIIAFAIAEDSSPKDRPDPDDSETLKKKERQDMPNDQGRDERLDEDHKNVDDLEKYQPDVQSDSETEEGIANAVDDMLGESFSRDNINRDPTPEPGTS